MNYLVIENNNEEELTYDIISFFWDNSIKISIQKEYTNNDNIICADCIIFLDNKSFSRENIVKTKLFIHFCNDGVYSNAIPFPHRIYKYNCLNRNAISAFFSWCKSLNLFEK
jgi:hypothetical protein